MCLACGLLSLNSFHFSLLAFSFYGVWCRRSFHFREFDILVKQTDVLDLECLKVFWHFDSRFR